MSGFSEIAGAARSVVPLLGDVQSSERLWPLFAALFLFALLGIAILRRRRRSSSTPRQTAGVSTPPASTAATPKPPDTGLRSLLATYLGLSVLRSQKQDRPHHRRRRHPYAGDPTGFDILMKHD